MGTVGAGVDRTRCGCCFIFSRKKTHKTQRSKTGGTENFPDQPSTFDLQTFDRKPKSVSPSGSSTQVGSSVSPIFLPCFSKFSVCGPSSPPPLLQKMTVWSRSPFAIGLKSIHSLRRFFFESARQSLFYASRFSSGFPSQIRTGQRQ